MRKLICACLALFVLSCSDDDGGNGPDPNVELVTGTWQLSELRITPEQDIDEDGTPTTNILEELTCVSAEIILRSDNTWTFSGNDVIITTITEGLFKFFCSDQIRMNSGNWDLQGTTLRLADDTGVVTRFTFSAEAMTLTNTIGETLPELQAEIYTKQ